MFVVHFEVSFMCLFDMGMFFLCDMFIVFALHSHHQGKSLCLEGLRDLRSLSC